jgi:hypothetical protein
MLFSLNVEHLQKPLATPSNFILYDVRFPISVAGFNLCWMLRWMLRWISNRDILGQILRRTLWITASDPWLGDLNLKRKEDGVG